MRVTETLARAAAALLMRDGPRTVIDPETAKRAATRERRNDARRWAATAGGAGGTGTPKVAAFMEARLPNVKGDYRAERRNKARVTRRVILKMQKDSTTR